MEVIAWERLCDYIRKQLPAVIPIDGKKRLSIAVGKSARTLSLRIPYDGESTGLASPYRELTYEMAAVEGRRVLELSTSSPELFHGFYLFAILIAEHIEEHGEDVLTAVHRAQQTFGQLLLKRSLITEARQIGLMGELCLLQGVLRGWGNAGFNAWLGPAGERHDFRMGEAEIEVKSTTASSRRHLINGLGQLEPSPGKNLYVLSIQFELAGMGGGQTLPDRIQNIRGLLNTHVEQKSAFEEYVKALGYVDADAPLYMQAYQLRSRPVLVPVNADFPKLTGEEVAKVVPAALLSRIDSVQYEVDLGGLGYPEGSSPFAEVLQNISTLE